jgi:DNA-binding NarL/FixJ family response regulator
MALPRFTQRESDVLALLVAGRDETIKHMARRLESREGTIKVHLAHIYAKLDVHSRAGVLARLLREQRGTYH